MKRKSPQTRPRQPAPRRPPGDEFVFGRPLAAASSAEIAAWLTETVDLTSWTVGGLLPNTFESYLLIEPAPERIADWLGAQRQIFAALAEVLRRFTATPDVARFAIWDGHSSSWGSFSEVPLVEIPTRSYYLIEGRVLDVAHIVDPLHRSEWRRPDLWWPDDQQWFLGTDVDIWASYLGGTQSMVEAVVSRLPGLCQPATLQDRLRVEA